VPISLTTPHRKTPDQAFSRDSNSMTQNAQKPQKAAEDTLPGR